MKTTSTKKIKNEDDLKKNEKNEDDLKHNEKNEDDLKKKFKKQIGCDIIVN